MKTNHREETGIEELRALVSMAGYTTESAFDDLDVPQTVKLLRACRALNLEVLPDMLTEKERRSVARSGRFSKRVLHRLYDEMGESKTGRDWEEVVCQ